MEEARKREHSEVGSYGQGGDDEGRGTGVRAKKSSQLQCTTLYVIPLMHQGEGRY